jgi:hypothetical protein
MNRCDVCEVLLPMLYGDALCSRCTMVVNLRHITKEKEKA